MDYMINVEIWVSADSPEEAERGLEAVLDNAQSSGVIVAFQLDGPVATDCNQLQGV